MKRRWVLAGATLLLVLGWALALTVESFATHMIAHVIAVAVAAPLLAIALERRPRFLVVPMAALVAAAVELVVVWGWHAPVLHAAARGSAVVYVVEQLSFLAAGYGVWASAVPSPLATARVANTLVGVGALAMTSMHMTLLGGLLAVSSEPWYHHGGGEAALWDQQLGGAIMLGLGGIAYLIGSLALLARAIHRTAGPGRAT